MPKTDCCNHKPRKLDRDAGYDACMWCVETGCDHKAGNGHGLCKTHSLTWRIEAQRNKLTGEL